LQTPRAEHSTSSFVPVVVVPCVSAPFVTESVTVMSGRSPCSESKVMDITVVPLDLHTAVLDPSSVTVTLRMLSSSSSAVSTSEADAVPEMAAVVNVRNLTVKEPEMAPLPTQVIV